MITSSAVMYQFLPRRTISASGIRIRSLHHSTTFGIEIPKKPRILLSVNQLDFNSLMRLRKLSISICPLVLVVSCLSLILRITFAGLPATIVSAGTSLVTTLAAPTTALYCHR